MEREFVRVHSAKDITISASLVIIGAILVTLPTGASINILGFFMIFAGLIIGLTLKTGYKEVTTGEKYCKKEIFFAQSMRDEISRSIASNPDSVNMKEEDKGNGIRLDIYHSKNTGKAYVQLFEYVPYKYEPCSKMYEHEVAKISKLLK